MVKAIWFADDQAMVADTEKGLQEITDVLQATSKAVSYTHLTLPTILRV